MFLTSESQARKYINAAGLDPCVGMLEANTPYEI
jgi:hypothetical protein